MLNNKPDILYGDGLIKDTSCFSEISSSIPQKSNFCDIN